MKVILLEDVKKVGKKDAVIEVSAGYATNYLIKNKLAVPLTKKSKEVLDKELDKRAQEEKEKVLEYQKIKEKLANKTIIFKVKTGAQDKVFGKISTKQIADELKSKGFNIDKKMIKLDSDLATLGIHEVEIILHKEVKFMLNINLSK